MIDFEKTNWTSGIKGPAQQPSAFQTQLLFFHSLRFFVVEQPQVTQIRPTA
jgi:hypothetical protein